MVSASILKFLSSQIFRDARCLLNGQRHKACIYLTGYALECELKRQICLTFGFEGFPETRSELNSALEPLRNGILPLGIPSNINDIRNHNLSLLLRFSGKQTIIMTNYPHEWSILSQWHPSSRYQMHRVTHNRASEFMQFAKIIMREMN